MPRSSARGARASPAPTAEAAMTLCPQAWPVPGRASYSAHTPTTIGPPPAVAISAVGRSQTPLSTSKPPAASDSPTQAAARSSSKATSGWEWIVWLWSTRPVSWASSSRWAVAFRSASSFSPLAAMSAPSGCVQCLFDHGDHVAGADSVARRNPDLGHRTRPVGVDVVLHLHGLEHAHRLAHVDLVALLHQDLDDGPLHGHGDRPRPRPAGRTRRRSRARRARSGRPARGAAGEPARHRCIGPPR